MQTPLVPPQKLRFRLRRLGLVLACLTLTGIIAARCHRGETVSGPALEVGLEGCTLDVQTSPRLHCLMSTSAAGTDTRLLLALQPVPEDATLVVTDQHGQPLKQFEQPLEQGKHQVPRTSRWVELAMASTPSEVHIVAQRNKAEVGRVSIEVTWNSFATAGEPDPAKNCTTAPTTAQMAQEEAWYRDTIGRARAPIERIWWRNRLVNRLRWQADCNWPLRKELVARLKAAAHDTRVEATEHKLLRTQAKMMGIEVRIDTKAGTQSLDLLQEIGDALPSFANVPKNRAYLIYALAEAAQRQRKNTQAFDLIDQAVQVAESINDRTFAPQYRLRKLETRQSLGDDIEADLQAEAKLLATTKSPDCLLDLQMWHFLAWVRLIRLEKRPEQTMDDPLEDLRAVLARTQAKGDCENPDQAQLARASLARRLTLTPELDLARAPGVPTDQAAKITEQQLAQQRAHMEEAQTYSRDARTADGETLRPELALDVLLAEARVALFHRNVPAALKKRDELHALLTQQEGQINQLGRVEDRWEVLCGLGATLLRAMPRSDERRGAEKESWLRTCDTLLNELALATRITDQAAAIAPENQGYSRLFAAFQGDPPSDRSLDEFMRKSIRRSTILHRWLSPKLRDLPTELKRMQEDQVAKRQPMQQWMKDHADHLANPLDVTQEVRDAVAKERLAEIDALDEFFRKADRHPQSIQAQESLPALRPTWLTLYCVPRSKERLLCITQLGPERLLHDMKRRELKSLLEPYQHLIAQSATGTGRPPIEGVLVIGEGWSEGIDITTWPVADERPLGAALPVATSLDITPLVAAGSASAPPDQPSHHLFLLHPMGIHGRTDDLIGQMERAPASAQHRYWTGQPTGLAPGKILPDASMIGLEQELATTSVFAVLGHVAADLCDPVLVPQTLRSKPLLSGFCLPKKEVLWAGNILKLNHVPRFAFLLGCSSAAGSPGRGASSINTANAFVLRGTEAALGTVHEIDVRLADEVMCHLTRAKHLGKTGYDLPKEFLRIVRLLRSGQSCLELHDPSVVRALSWQSIRVFLPS